MRHTVHHEYEMKTFIVRLILKLSPILQRGWQRGFISHKIFHSMFWMLVINIYILFSFVGIHKYMQYKKMNSYLRRTNMNVYQRIILKCWLGGLYTDLSCETSLSTWIWYHFPRQAVKIHPLRRQGHAKCSLNTCRDDIVLLMGGDIGQYHDWGCHGSFDNQQSRWYLCSIRWQFSMWKAVSSLCHPNSEKLGNRKLKLYVFWNTSYTQIVKKIMKN